jgi:predicted nucleotidyltransferase component of viral defense system
MISAPYKDQVKLLLAVIPEVAKEHCFALHGGTAINLFIRDMPRLSVDIDLTYIPIESRNESFQKITHALSQIKTRIERAIPNLDVVH